jgi:hypothetical protein
MKFHHMLLFGALAMACDEGGQASEADPNRGPLGKADANGSCADGSGDFCGGQSAHGCFCDAECVDFGDCCSDAASVCQVAQCPDPADPTVSYLSEDGLECAALTFSCGAGETLFSDECGCGCIGTEDPGCPDAADPNVNYMFEDPVQCQAALFMCEEGQTQFSNDCGCGCIGEGADVCPDPNDPRVDYTSEDPLECAAALIMCAEGEELFSNGCGCGCIAP